MYKIILCIYFICIYVIFYMYIFMHTCAYMHTGRQAGIRTYIYTYIHTYIHTYVHTSIHTYMHTYTYVCKKCNLYADCNRIISINFQNYNEVMAWFLVILNINITNDSACCDFCLHYQNISILHALIFASLIRLSNFNGLLTLNQMLTLKGI